MVIHRLKSCNKSNHKHLSAKSVISKKIVRITSLILDHHKNSEYILHCRSNSYLCPLVKAPSIQFGSQGSVSERDKVVITELGYINILW